MNLEMMCETTLSHQQHLLQEAAERRLVSSGTATPTVPLRRGGRRRVACLLRRFADWLEPAPSQPRVALLRAVAHHEIDVEQAMRLLASNGLRSRHR